MTTSNNRMRTIVATLIALIALVSCTSNDVYNSFIALPNTGWGEDSLAVFRANIEDATAAYDINIQIRNQNNYKYANLWLFIDVIAPDGELVRDTTECLLAQTDGTWIGSGWGSLYTLQCPYRLRTRFAKPGTYTFRIAHGMRDEEIEGIHSLGLRIVKSEQ